MSGHAQQEYHRIGRRVHSNMHRLSDEGKLVCRPPFEYIHDPRTRTFVPDQQQQEIVKKIEILHINGVCMNEMARRLNGEGLGTILNNNKKKINPNAKFTADNIGLILRGYGFIKDEKSPKFTHPQRVEVWNSTLHKIKVNHKECFSDGVPKPHLSGLRPTGDNPTRNNN
jgi:hypothetical protein